MSNPAWTWRWPGLDLDLMVSSTVASVFQRHTQDKFSTERGGQLFVDPGCPDGLMLSLATLPHHADKTGRTWLELDTERCKEEIEQGNKLGLWLVGYWHTHPQLIPQISPADISSFVRFARRYKNELPYPVAIIVGTSPAPDGIKVWSFRAEGHIEGIRIDGAKSDNTQRW
ncbi:hypothetical protein [Xenorhabdus bovienii]|uniref:JAB domain-containing protein n=1 Tax=Xenorhabdus bovienii str. kraussei Becker Underwood TaxID=1398204 RepID=A0A077PZS5_XENBV|nr:hypothetical protein [Xenorhabdus bovienii]CDH26271.1 conserved hypothetical protein [Xenorhabdus bovienii str. kraussei Becker Underwood]